MPGGVAMEGRGGGVTLRVWALLAWSVAGCRNAEQASDGAVQALACPAPEAVWFDADGDGVGDSAVETRVCGVPPPGYVREDGDCDDFLASVFPGSQEVCGDGVDQDCDGVDEACSELPLVWTIAGEEGQGLGVALVGGEDFTGDGVADVVVSGTKAGASGGVVQIWGGPLHPEMGPAASADLTGPMSAMYGASLASVGDMNGDGTADLIWGAPGDGHLGDGVGRVWIGWGPFVGSVSGGMGSSLVAGDNGVWGLGSSVAAGADLTGDGVADLLMGAPSGGAWTTYRGLAYVLPMPLATDHVPSVGLDGLEFEGAELASDFGAALGMLEDRNGDGFSDLAIAAPASDGSTGAVYVWWGPVSAGGVADDADEALVGPSPGSRFGETLHSADVDRDGRTDLLVGAPSLEGGRVVGALSDGSTFLLTAEVPWQPSGSRSTWETSTATESWTWRLALPRPWTRTVPWGCGGDRWKGPPPWTTARMSSKEKRWPAGWARAWASSTT